jgi:hypothetical protein
LWNSIPKQDLMEMGVEAVEPDLRKAVMTTYEQIRQEGRRRFSSVLCRPSSVLRFYGFSSEDSASSVRERNLFFLQDPVTQHQEQIRPGR